MSTETDLRDPAALTDFCRNYMDAVNTNDPDRVAAACTEDLLWYDVSLPAPIRGRENVRQFLADVYSSLSDLRVTEPDPPLRSITADGSAISWEWRTIGTLRLPDRPPIEVDFPGVDLWRMRDGLIADYRGYWDTGVLTPTA